MWFSFLFILINFTGRNRKKQKMGNKINEKLQKIQLTKLITIKDVSPNLTFSSIKMWQQNET